MKNNPPMLVSRGDYMKNLCRAAISKDLALAKDAMPEIYKLIKVFNDAEYFVFYSAMVGTSPRYLSKAFKDKHEANQFYEKLRDG